MVNVENRDSFQGKKVHYIHLRYECPWEEIAHNMGGATIAYTEEEGLVSRVALAVCSRKDNFSREVGRIISRERLHFKDDIEVANRITSTEFREWADAAWMFGLLGDLK